VEKRVILNIVLLDCIEDLSQENEPSLVCEVDDEVIGFLRNLGMLSLLRLSCSVLEELYEAVMQ
jgi:hypothetical protein